MGEIQDVTAAIKAAKDLLKASGDMPTKSHVRQSVWFTCRVTEGFADQMNVFRWLQHDDQYRAIWILHDKDVYTAEDAAQGKQYTTPDGEKHDILEGERKPAHYHVIVKTPRKLSEKTFSGRFGNYVNFQILGDPSHYAWYLTHDTFDSQNKYRYDRSCVEGDLDMFKDLTKGLKASEDFGGLITAYMEALACCSGNKCATINYLLKIGRADVVSSIASHAYFYKEFCSGEDSDERG